MLIYLLNSNGPQAGLSTPQLYTVTGDITQLRIVLTVVTLSRAGRGPDLTFVLDKNWEIKTNAIK